MNQENNSSQTEIPNQLKGIYNYWEGKHLSEEHKKAIGEGNKGKVISEEHRKKISESTSGDKNHRYGKELTDEHKSKISETVSGENHSRFNKTVYKFINKSTNEEYISNSYNFRIKYNLDNRNVHPILKNPNKSCKGWKCVGEFN